MTFKKIYWLIPVGIIGLIVAFALVAYYRGDKPTGAILSRGDEKAVKSNITKDKQTADEKKQARDRSAAAAEKPIAEANTAVQRATILRTQTHKPKPHAKPVPVSDSAAIELQRYLSNY